MKTPDPFEYIRNYYKVPAKKEQRVRITLNPENIRSGRIVGAEGQYIRVHFDGDAKQYPGVFHPTDSVEYL